MTRADQELSLAVSYFAGAINAEQLRLALKYEQRTGAIYRAALALRDALRNGRIAIQTDVDR